MASGDVFANMNLAVPDATFVSVQPALGVSAMICFIQCQNNAYNTFGGENATGRSANFNQGDITANIETMYRQNNNDIKFFITNSQWFWFKADNGGGHTMTFSYSGIEI